MIIIDGAQGEGGGQILRTSLALAAVTGTPLRLENIRAGRAKPGLARQHLTCAKAAAAVCGGSLVGAEVGSTRLEFRPGRITAGDYAFSIGTAGSTGLVLQTVLPILLAADGPSSLKIEGGTHNPGGPSFDFLARAFLPTLSAMGSTVSAKLSRYGFYPAGGGLIEAHISPGSPTKPFVLHDRGALRDRGLIAMVSNIPETVAQREIAAFQEALDWPECDCAVAIRHSDGPGNVCSADLVFDNGAQHFAQFGQKGLSAERVGRKLAKSVKAFLSTKAGVCSHLADQLLLPMALGHGGSFTTMRPSRHTVTNADIIRQFLPVSVTFDEGPEAWTVHVSK